MPKKSATPTVYQRGPILWMRFRYSKQQIRRPLSGEFGAKLRIGANYDEIMKAVFRGWEQFKAEQEQLNAKLHGRWTIADLTAAYVEKRSPRWDILTIKQYENWMTSMESFFGPKMVAVDITVEDAEEFQSYLSLDKKLANGTVNNRITFAKQLFKWGQKRNYCTSNPFDGIDPLAAKPVREKLPFTPDEVKNLLAAALLVCPHMHLCIALLAVTGIRRTCSRLLLVQHFNPDTHVLSIPAEIMKLEKAAKFYLPPGLSALIKQGIKGRPRHGSLLVNRQGRPLADWEYDVTVDKSKWDQKSSWRKVLEAADIPLRGVHQFRSGVATQIVTKAIQQAIKVTQNTADVCRDHYAEITGEAQRSILTKIETDLGLDSYAKADVIQLTPPE